MQKFEFYEVKPCGLGFNKEIPTEKIYFYNDNKSGKQTCYKQDREGAETKCVVWEMFCVTVFPPINTRKRSWPKFNNCTFSMEFIHRMKLTKHINMFRKHSAYNWNFIWYQLWTCSIWCCF